jgi:hypothetical protein
MSFIKESGQAAPVGDEMVIMTVGHSKGRVRYLVMSAWPNSMTVEERVRNINERLIYGDKGQMILMPSGYEPIETTGMAYFIRGSTCETMKIKMSKDTVPMLHLRPFADSREIWDFFRHYAA